MLVNPNSIVTAYEQEMNRYDQHRQFQACGNYKTWHRSFCHRRYQPSVQTFSAAAACNFRFKLTVSGKESDSESLVMNNRAVHTVKRLWIRCGSVQLLYSYVSITLLFHLSPANFSFYHPVVLVCNKELFKCRQELMYITLFSVAKCFDIIRSSSGH